MNLPSLTPTVTRRAAQVAALLAAAALGAAGTYAAVRPAPTPAPAGDGTVAAPPAAAESVTVELSDGCADAVAPVRTLMATVTSGLLLDDTANETLSAALSTAATVCDEDELADYHTRELRPWLNAPRDR